MKYIIFFLCTVCLAYANEAILKELENKYNNLENKYEELKEEIQIEMEIKFSKNQNVKIDSNNNIYYANNQLYTKKAKNFQFSDVSDIKSFKVSFPSMEEWDKSYRELQDVKLAVYTLESLLLLQKKIQDISQENEKIYIFLKKLKEKYQNIEKKYKELNSQIKMEVTFDKHSYVYFDKSNKYCYSDRKYTFEGESISFSDVDIREIEISLSKTNTKWEDNYDKSQNTKLAPYILESLQKLQQNIHTKSIDILEDFSTGDLIKTKGELESTNQDLIKTKGELESTNQDLIKTKGELESANQDLIKTKGELESTNQDLIKTKGELESANQDLIKTKGELESTNQDLIKTKGELESTNQDLIRTKGELESTNQDLIKTKGELESTNQDLIKTKGEFELILEKFTELIKMGEKIKSLESIIDNLKIELNLFKKQYDIVQNNYFLENIKFTDLQIEFDKIKKVNSILISKLKEFRYLPSVILDVYLQNKGEITSSQKEIMSSFCKKFLQLIK